LPRYRLADKTEVKLERGDRRREITTCLRLEETIATDANPQITQITQITQIQKG